MARLRAAPADLPSSRAVERPLHSPSLPWQSPGRGGGAGEQLAPRLQAEHLEGHRHPVLKRGGRAPPNQGFQPRPVPPCTSALSTPAGSGAGGEGPAMDPALHAPCTTVLGPLTDPLSPQSGVSVLQKGDSSFCRWLLPPLHPLRPHLKAWGAVWLSCGGRDLQATVPSHKDTAALPRTRQTSPHHRFHALLLCLVLTRGLGLPGTNGRTSGPCLRGSAPLLGL